MYNIKKQENDIIISGLDDFNLDQTLECGQCFNFYKLNNMEYVISAMGMLLHVSQNEKNIFFHDCSLSDAHRWIYYFDLDRDYGKIKKELIKRAPELKDAIEDKWGIRILNQEFTETLMSFIISQNKQIPHIKQIVKQLCVLYGEKTGSVYGTDYYGFPDKNVLSQIGIDGFIKCRTGFRAKYLQDATEKICNGLSEKTFTNMKYEEALNKLKEIKGVGDKVANCVLLFSLGYRSAFPVDVWVKRVMEEEYFHEDTDKEKIMEFAKERFGEYGGYAQQYLFYHRRG